jgi:hypothetical protein
LVIQRGRKPSAATKLARKGNPLKGVLAPVYRISIVASCTSRKPTCPAALSPSTALATWEMTVGEPAT